MRRECRECFPRHRGLAISRYIFIFLFERAEVAEILPRGWRWLFIRGHDIHLIYPEYTGFSTRSVASEHIHQSPQATETDVTNTALQWRHDKRDVVSNHQPHDCLLKRLFRRKSRETSKLRVTGLCAGNSPVTGEFPAQWASNAESFFHLMTSAWHVYVYIYIHICIVLQD